MVLGDRVAAIVFQKLQPANNGFVQDMYEPPIYSRKKTHCLVCFSNNYKYTLLKTNLSEKNGTVGFSQVALFVLKRNNSASSCVFLSAGFGATDPLMEVGPIHHVE